MKRKTRNPIAKSLKSPHLKPQIVPPQKGTKAPYDRKVEIEIPAED